MNHFRIALSENHMLTGIYSAGTKPDKDKIVNDNPYLHDMKCIHCVLVLLSTTKQGGNSLGRVCLSVHLFVLSCLEGTIITKFESKY